MKHNVRRRNFESLNRAIPCTYTHDNSENIHPNRLSNSSSYVNQSQDAGRNRSLATSYSFNKANNFTIQDNDTSWYSGKRPLSSISTSQRQIAPRGNSGTNPPTIASTQKEDLKINNAFYRPLWNAPIGFSSYKPWKPTESMGNHKRCFNSLSTIVKDDTIQNEDVSTIHPLDTSHALSPLKTDEEGSRIYFIQNLNTRIWELEQLVDNKNKIIEEQKQTIVTLKNQAYKSLNDAEVQVDETEFAPTHNSIINDIFARSSHQIREKNRLEASDYQNKNMRRVELNNSFHITGDSSYDTPLINAIRGDNVQMDSKNNSSVEKYKNKDRSFLSNSDNNRNSASMKSNLSRKGINIGLKNLNLK